MIGLLVLVLIGAVVLVVFLGRKQEARPAGGETSREGFDVLERAVSRGLLSRDLADAIISAERAHEPSPPPPRESARPVPALAEAIGYVGAILVMVGMVVLVAQVWEDLETWSRLAIVGAVAVLLFVVGLLLRDEENLVIWRLRSFVWLLAAGALAGFTGLLTVDALSWEGEAVAIAIGAVTAPFGAALWQLKDRPAQHLTTFAGLLVMAGGVMAWLDVVDPSVSVGVSVLAIGAAWLTLGLLDRLPPQLVAVALGTLATLVGPAITAGEWDKPAPVIGLTVAIALVGIGSSVHEFAVTGFGVAGLFAYLPWTLGALFGDAVGPPVILLVSGVLLLAVMFVLLRSRGGPGRVTGDGSGHFLPPTRPAH
jgi:hypothetical protein